LTPPSTWKDPSKLSEIRKKKLKIEKDNTSEQTQPKIENLAN
jgi:hypothetical protein